MADMEDSRIEVNGSAGASPSQPLPQRARPAHGVYIDTFKSTIIFLTVCTKDRSPWLAHREVHELLVDVWRQSSAWLIGRYVIMPDHLHLFASPGQPEIALDNWVRYWKSQFTKRYGRPQHRWQPSHWDRRLRNDESYAEKWDYTRLNPVRHGLVAHAEDWPFQGELNILRW